MGMWRYGNVEGVVWDVEVMGMCGGWDVEGMGMWRVWCGM